MSNQTINIKRQLFASPPKNSKYYIIAVDGRGGAGKTTLSKHVLEKLDDFSVICGDDYFEPIEHPIAWGGYNEERLLKDVIEPIKNGFRDVNYHPYDWSKGYPAEEKIHINKGVLIDRCYSFSFKLDFDLRIWVETPREITLNRGISRSSMPEIRAEKVWRELWKPLEDRYILEIKPQDIADMVIDGTSPFENQIA